MKISKDGAKFPRGISQAVLLLNEKQKREPMTDYSERSKDRFLENLRLVNERSGVDLDTIDLLEAFARYDLDRSQPVNLSPEAPSPLSRRVAEFLDQNQHLPDQARTFLAAYAQRLQDSGIPFVFNLRHLGHLLGISPERLLVLSTSADKRYSVYRIPKRDGSLRTIEAPQAELKTVQRAILDKLLHAIPLNPHAEGFRRNRSIVSNSARHVGQKVVIKVDLKDFFPSITADRVMGLFLSLGFPRQVASLLARLTTCNGRLATGAPTSPAISNLVCRRLDRRMAGLGLKSQFEYSRYADDLTFSSQNPALTQMLPFLQQLISEEGFTVKGSKTRILRCGGQQKVTGIVVNDKPNIARKEVRTLRAILHNCQQGNLQQQAAQYGHRFKGIVDYPLASFRASIQGRINHIRRVNPEVGERLLQDFLAITFPV